MSLSFSLIKILDVDVTQNDYIVLVPCNLMESIVMVVFGNVVCKNLEFL